MVAFLIEDERIFSMLDSSDMLHLLFLMMLCNS